MAERRRRRQSIRPSPRGAQNRVPLPTPAQSAGPPQVQPLQWPDDKEQLAQLIESLERERNSRVIVYWTTQLARISEAVTVPLYDQLESLGHQEHLDLYLFTRGGDTEAPWRIVSLLREYCAYLGVLVPQYAMSSGTLLALGADEIVMTKLGVLGPIDPSRSHPLLPKREGAQEAEAISVQDMRHAMQFIREARGQVQDYTPEAMAQIFSALFEKIHPLAIGAIEQSYALSKLIAKKCLGTHMDRETQGTEIERIADSLCDDFKSHIYPIGRAEARSIGLKVTQASPTLETAMMELWKFYTQRPSRATAEPPRPNSSETVVIAWLDSRELNFRVDAHYFVKEDGSLQHRGDEWTSY